MKECFVEKRFSAESLSRIEQINAILEEYREQGYVLTVRQAYYQLVARGVIENTERSYKSVAALISNARMAGLMDWGMIEDRNRIVRRRAHWESVEDMLLACSTQFRMDRWEGQDNYVEVMVEKEALTGILLPVCEKFDVALTANKGYSSSSAVYEAAQRMAEKRARGLGIAVLYMGDHDPSGIDMSRELEQRLRLFGHDFVGPLCNSSFEFRRLALNMGQVEALKPPPNPAKQTDSRYATYAEEYGDESWELDAIEPTSLVTLLVSALLLYIDPEKWDATNDSIQGGRDRLKEFALGIKREGAGG